MKIFPAVIARLRALRPGPAKRSPEVGVTAAAALSLLAVAIVFIAGEAYLSRVTLTVDERSAFLNTLLLCDVLVFGITLLATAILWHLSSISYGSRPGFLNAGTLPIYVSLMLLPIVFAACDLAFKPLFFSRMEVEVALALSVVGIAALAPYSVAILEQARPRGILAGLVEEIEKELVKAGRTGPLEPVALQGPALRGSAGTRLAALLDKLCRSGDYGPVLGTLGQMRETALFAKGDGLVRAAVSANMVSMIMETAVLAAGRGGTPVVYRALDELRDISVISPHAGTASLAFRSMGGVFSFCGTDERSAGRLGARMMEGYCSIYDRTGRHEALEAAAAVAEKLADSRAPATGEHDVLLYLSGGVHRRLADAEGSEEHANRALALLLEALAARTAEASPMDHACIKGEIGRAYMALARVKNPVKSYRSAAAAFEDAGRMLDAGAFPWDSAQHRGRAAGAYTMLADEYCRGKRYDDALQAARSALALYPEAVKFFEKRSAGDLAEVSSGQGFAHTIVSEVYLRSRMLDLSLKHAALALDAYSLASGAVDVKATPGRFAFIRMNIGLTHVTMAEIHFREKRYESAIASCDSAIAAYNEAIRGFDELKEDRQAAVARRHLKKANDLFNTMMRIGVADRKPQAPVAEQ